MEALRATYGSDDDDSSGSSPPPIRHRSGGDHHQLSVTEPSSALPPPPLDLLQPPNFIDYSSMAQGIRVRSFPHSEGNYSLHIFIPVLIPPPARKQLGIIIKKLASLVRNVYAVDADYAISDLCQDDQKLEKLLLNREFHISLGRTVAIQVHQIDSIVAMLRQKFHSQRRYSIEFNKWEFFVNDDYTRSFLSLEITGDGLDEIIKQINVVNEIYRLHGLPEFYENPRPHISLVWALGDVSQSLKQAVEEIYRSQNSKNSSQRINFRCMFNSIVCKVGKKSYHVCKLPD